MAEPLLERAEGAVRAARAFAAAAQDALRERTCDANGPVAALLEREQRAGHGYAWIETTVAALAALHAWATGCARRDRLDEAERLVVAIAFGEYLAQLLGGLPMGQNEFVRPGDLGLEHAAAGLAADADAASFVTAGNTAENRAALAECLAGGVMIAEDLGDETLDAIRDQFRRFTDQRIIPDAHRLHLENALIPDAIVAEMAALGTFGVCIDEQYGGLGLGKFVMCIVTEELSRGWIAAGSLGTRSEIAGELVMQAGTEAQRQEWLPRIASGEVLPTAVFTEPDTGSDLGNIATRAVRCGDGWRISGAKTWITHASRSDLMTLLARSSAEVKGHGGISMFLVPKQRGTADAAFPDDWLDGTEIEVLGYRGMREYELSFEELALDAGALLGEVEGQGFRQLMQTFEGARIQTAARAVGVARRALELGLSYATERKQFGKAIVRFPRVADKLAMMAAETVAARELTYFAAGEKDKGRRCDIEAGMAKLLAARVSWSNADAALQIHGGNGYALEYEISRVLCDARILNIFEGAAEIQAQVIARGKLAGG